MTSTSAAEDLVTKVRRAFAETDGFDFDSLEPHDYQRPTAAVLRAVADVCDTAGGEYANRGLNDQAGAAFHLMEQFMGAADLAEYVATPCSIAACEPGGEPCLTHERLMAHAEGDHELCNHTADGSAV